jgi:hypothetical protein
MQPRRPKSQKRRRAILNASVDPSLKAAIVELAARRGIPFSHALEELVRRGLGVAA